MINTDTCAAAQKLRRILTEAVPGAYDFDCMHHLRNVWIGGVEKALTSRLNEILQDSADEIDPKLRVSASISAVIRAVDKEFSLSANYPKGHGELFREWMRANHAGELLLHVERASGSRQDLCTEGCMAIIMNWPFYLEFLDEQLCKRKSSGPASILQQNLFCVLKSSEMISLARLLTILHLSVTMPMRWLAGKSHELKEWGWGALSMGRAIDTLEAKLEELSDDPSKILDEDFMMTIFSEYLEELPPFKEYYTEMFERKKMSVINRKSATKVVHLSRLRRQLFRPVRKTERDASERTIELAGIAAEAFIAELRDENKATHKYLSRFKKDYSYSYASAEKKQAFLGKKATNDEAESALGGATAQLQRFGRVSLSHAAAVSDLKRNAFFHRPSSSKSDTKSPGLFHQFHPALQEAILVASMQDAPERRKANNEALEQQAAARHAKEQLAKEKNLARATEEYIEGTYLIHMYHSDACVKGDPKLVTKMLKKLGSETAQYNFLKCNINIRVRGFGWSWAHHAWSKDGSRYSVSQLANHLRWIIREENKRIARSALSIPTEPPINIPARHNVGVFGTEIDFISELDSKYLADECIFKKKAEEIRQRREDRGEESIFSRMQPFYRPELCSLVGQRIDFHACFGEAGMRWCQGEVLEVLSNKSRPTVNVLWDVMPDVDEYANKTEDVVELLPSKWNKDCDGAWRMDIDLAIGDEEDNLDDQMVEEDDNGYDTDAE